MTTGGLIILGFGGHARSVAEVALATGYEDLIFVEPTASPGENLWGHPAQSTFDGPIPPGWQTFPGSGDNRTRRAQVQTIQDHAWPLATLIAPSATICRDASIASGCFVAHHAHIGPLSTVGTGCIINTGALVDHESSIGEFTHVSVNSTVAGRCRLGRFVFLGAGATVIDKMSIADSITIGAGAVVTEPLMHAGTYVGIPARPIQSTGAAPS
ncbi:NeuD/PglB/VioB family sugar acetyltransferase [Bradyrhizobium diazoefficiens]|nr:NeuD/PglB/VioB family sugar acetyltransferase [Bradyrhizobium diazoefficiens]MBR0850298.1 NeuD/PglB/VioB family sugar acetyltransferase [Bradyrhizobium diazoefficiens]